MNIESNGGKYMKKLILIFVFSTILTFTACGSDSEDNTTTETTTQTTETMTIESTTETTDIETTTTEEPTTITETTTVEPVTTTETTTVATLKSGSSVKEAKVPTSTSAVSSNGNVSGSTGNSSSSDKKDYITVEQEDTSSRTVWIGDKGTKYHRKDCRTLKGNKYEITYDEAIRQGRKACKVCYD